jgi:hypothetical protein
VPIPSQQAAGSQAIPKTDEKAVLLRIAEGDVAALGTLFDQNARAIYSLAMSVLGSHDKAEDVVEETLWQAWEKSAQIVGEPDIPSWLVSTAGQRLGVTLEGADPIPDQPINPGRAAGIRSRLISRATADTDRRAVPVTGTAASRVKPPSAGKSSAAPKTLEESDGRQRAALPSSGMAVVAGIAILIAVGAVIQMLRANSEANSLRATIQVQREGADAESKPAAIPALDEDRIVAAVTGPDVRVISLTHYGANGPVGKMFWNRQTNTWTLVTYSIRQPKPDRIFQVWLSTSKGTLPAGTFTPDANGRALVQSSNEVSRDGLYSISVTEEARGGAPTPSGPAVIAGAP